MPEPEPEVQRFPLPLSRDEIQTIIDSLETDLRSADVPRRTHMGNALQNLLLRVTVFEQYVKARQDAAELGLVVEPNLPAASLAQPAHP